MTTIPSAGHPRSPKPSAGASVSAFVIAALLGFIMTSAAGAQGKSSAPGAAVASGQPTTPDEESGPESKQHGKAHKTAAARKEPQPAQAAVPPPAVPAPTPAAPATPNAPAAPVLPAAPVALGELEPVLHARQAQLTTCMDSVVSQSGRVINHPHKAMSTWVTKAPNDNVFQSIVGLNYDNTVAPHGLAVILAAPLAPGRCEGQSVQIYPTARSCTVVQAALVKTGHTVSDLNGLPVIEVPGGFRNVLMPGTAGGCVVVTTHLQ